MKASRVVADDAADVIVSEVAFVAAVAKTFDATEIAVGVMVDAVVAYASWLVDLVLRAADATVPGRGEQSPVEFAADFD